MRNEHRHNRSQGKLIGLAIALLFTAPQLLIPVAIIGGIVFAVKKAAQSRQGSAGSASRYTSRQERFDDCPQPFFCFHKDKAEHHVRRGKEIDPWDRPDIDIRKYQRNR